MLSFCIDPNWQAPSAIQSNKILGSILPCDCWHYCTAVPAEGSAYASALLERVVIHNGANIATKRAIEFACGRSCAALALRSAGANVVTVLAASNRKPVWPTGFVGSITHTDEFCWAAVMPGWNGCHIGIDSERVLDAGTAADVVSLVAASSDVAPPSWLSFEEYVTVLFSVKESIYKAVGWNYANILDFKDVSIFGLTMSGFDWRIAAPTLDQSVTQGFGQYVIQGGMCHSAVQIHH